jgi:hypothetical protein
MEKRKWRRGGADVDGYGMWAALAGTTEAPTDDHVGQGQVPADGRAQNGDRAGSKNRPAALWLPAALLGVPTDHVSRLTSHISRRPVSLGQAMTCIQDRLHHHTLSPDHDHEPRVVWGPDGHALCAAYSRPANSPCNPHKDTASGSPR